MVGELADSGVTGVLSLAQLRAHPSYPSEERFRKGPVPIIECLEEIPCDPCQLACQRGCIRVGEPITNLPVLSDPAAACTGCGECVLVCPGLAIFIVDKSFSDTMAAVTLPYELLPLPTRGAGIVGLDRAGRPVCEGHVHRVRNAKAQGRTALVTIAVPTGHAEEVRFFRTKA